MICLHNINAGIQNYCNLFNCGMHSMPVLSWGGQYRMNIYFFRFNVSGKSDGSIRNRNIPSFPESSTDFLSSFFTAIESFSKTEFEHVP